VRFPLGITVRTYITGDREILMKDLIGRACGVYMGRYATCEIGTKDSSIAYKIMPTSNDAIQRDRACRA